MRRLRWPARTVVVVLALLCVTCLALRIFAGIQLNRGRKLVATAERVRLGETLAQQGISFFDIHCDSDDRCYGEKAVSSLPFAGFWKLDYRSMPPIAGLKWWAVGAYVELDKAGVVTSEMLGADDGRYAQFPTVEIRVEADSRLFDPCDFAGQFRHPDYDARREMRTGALFVTISPQSDVAFRRRAFDLHLECLNTWRGCNSPAELAPNAWHDMTEDKLLAESDRADADKLQRCNSRVLELPKLDELHR